MNNNLPSEAVAHAVAVLKNEHVIAYPTEAVFGVGCDLTAKRPLCACWS
ncbi:putative ribosome maturation factor [Klebsiella pneumoniae]|uniref:Putative ribosome maturation factor n=1 Tax=Klebsiella pneumoniae TaxID=573 RepID=A0A378B0N7_KLEPN|nr:putative ribosome maturation factor [Klebsiella pneumoniae]